MIKRVLIAVLVFFIIGLIIFWLLSGGLAASARTARTLINPIDLIFGTGTSTGMSLRLPWQPTTIPQGPDISGSAQAVGHSNTPVNEQVSDQSPNPSPSDARLLGFNSPYKGEITITDNTATESDPNLEYIQIAASESNTQPIAITDWSLQSAVSGMRIHIPQAAPLFTLGIINSVQPIYLAPGNSAIITTSASPVGTSLRENICSGYLNELQTFTPELSSTCPAPTEALPQTAENLRTYGSACFDYLNTLPTCHFPTALPSDLSSPCRQFLTNTMSYNGCVNTYHNRPDFTQTTWRIYLAMRAELWDNTHDVVRLLDDQGRVVDVLTY